jgi:hypothetical protein
MRCDICNGKVEDGLKNDEGRFFNT